MKRVHRIGLVTAGKITGLWIEKTLELKRNVGPVYSTSLRLASRASNTLLRTGFHTTDWEELRRCEAVLFFLPAKSLRSMIAEWLRCGYDLQGLRVVLCHDELGLADLAALRELGAHTAAVGPLPHSEQGRFVGEGDSSALAPVIRLLQADGLKFTRLNSGGKHRLTVAVDGLHGESLPMFARTVDSLRDAGLAPDVAVALAEKCFSQSLRLYARNGRRIWDARGPGDPSSGDPSSGESTGTGLLALKAALGRDWAETKPKARAAAAAAGISDISEDKARSAQP
jgi:hypothetical protein